MWSMVFCLFGINWVMLHKVIETFDCWPGLCLICVEDYQLPFLPTLIGWSLVLLPVYLSDLLF